MRKRCILDDNESMPHLMPLLPSVEIISFSKKMRIYIYFSV